MARIVGIDLGTTYSAVAYVNDLGQPEILPNSEGERIMPSVALFQGDRPVVGTMAKRSAALAPLDTVQFVKRFMGDSDWRFDTSSGESYRAEEISALYLARLRHDAEQALGEPVTEAVITVPAYFDDPQRRATMDAGRIAGLSVRRVLNEPTAAALSYGLDERVGGYALVYDLGGGTFDVTALRIGRGEFDILATDGDRDLGGFTWDSELMCLLQEKFAAAGGGDLLDGAELETDLRERAELAKRRLSQAETAQVTLSDGAAAHTVKVTRAEFEKATASLVSQSRDTVEAVLEEAGLVWPGISHLLLVGGSTRMPMVRRMLEGISGMQAARAVHPDEAVALGAAVQAHLLEVDDAPADRVPSNQAPLRSDGRPIRVRNVTSKALGTPAVNPTTGLAENSVIIPRNTRVPAKQAQTYRTIRPGQTEVDVTVTQGDDTDLRFVRVLDSEVSSVPIPPYPAGAPIEVIFAYDVDQTVFVEVTDLTAGACLGTFEVRNVANMTPEQIDAAADRLAATQEED